MLENILDFLGRFVPDPKLPTKDYLARLVSTSAIAVIIVTLIYFAVSGTVLGARWGLVKTVADVTNLSHVEFNKDQRDVWQALTQLRENDPTVRGAFVAVLYDIQSGNIITKDERKKSQSMLWTVSIPGTKFNSVDIIETAIAKVKPTFQDRFNEKKECFASKLTGEPLAILKRGIEDLKSTHFAACPIFTKKGFLVAASFIFIALPPDPLATTELLKNPKTEAVSEYSYELFALWSYQDRLRRMTALIDDKFRSFDAPHSFYYR